MSEADVFVLDPQGNVARELTIRVNGDNADFLIKSDLLVAGFLRNIDDRLSDFIDIVSSIFAADSRVRRGSNLRPEFGQG